MASSLSPSTATALYRPSAKRPLTRLFRCSISTHPQPPTPTPTPQIPTPPPTLRRREASAALALTLLGPAAFLAPPPSRAAGQESCVLAVAPSGLAFCDRKVGTGAPAVTGQLIKAHYVGKLENGKVFDSSYDRGKPLMFRVGVGEVIRGWDQGISGTDGIPPMLAGSKRTLKIPPELGYGARGAGCRGGSCIIPPDSTLLFDVEFIGLA